MHVVTEETEAWVDPEKLNDQRIYRRLMEWARVGRMAYKLEAKGYSSLPIGDLLSLAENEEE